MTEDKIVKKLVEHNERLDRIEEKLDKVATRDEMNARMDELLVILRKLDEDRLFTFAIYKRLEKDVEKVKKILKIA